MSLFTCLCTVRDGRLKLFDLDAFTLGLSEFLDGEELEMTIESVGERHTRAQEKFLHGPVLKAFMSEGRGKQEAKDMLALMFIPQEITLLDGTVVRVPGHTSKLKKAEYTEFIEQCIQLAAEQGYVIQDADEWLRTHRKAVTA